MSYNLSIECPMFDPSVSRESVTNIMESEQFSNMITGGDETAVVDGSKAHAMAQIMENQLAYQKMVAGGEASGSELLTYLTESDVPNGQHSTGWAGDIHDGSSNSSYDTMGLIPKLMMPILRRLLPELIFQEFYATQPMTGPTGLIMALRAMYAGTSVSPLSRGNAQIVGVQESESVITTGDTYTPLLDTRGITFSAAADSHLTFSNGATGFVRHVEDSFLVVEIISGSNPSDGDTVSAAGGTNPLTVRASYPLEASYQIILKRWAKPYLPNYNSFDDSNTAAMIGIGDTMPQMAIEFEKVQVTANTNKIGATFPMELAQDLRASTGLNVVNELIRVLKEQLAAAKNREAIDVMNSLAKQMTSYDVANTSQGRWHMERIRALRLRTDFLAQDIFQRSRRGAGNKLLVSPNVLVLLAQLPDFTVATTSGSLQFGKARAGRLGNLEVFVDHFARSEYMTMAFRGASSFDGGLFYAPYIEAMMGRARHPDGLFSERIGFMSRYALGRNPYGPSNYYTYQPISNIGTILGLS